MLKNSLLNKFRNFLLVAVLLLGLLASTYFAGVFTSNKAFASTKENVSDSLLTNYNFYTSSKLSTPRSVSGWSLISGIENQDDFKKGVISSKHDEYTEYKEAYGLKNVDYIGTVDNTSNTGEDPGYYHNLMISTQNNDTSFSGRLGYKSNSITLSSDSFYIITVKLKTINTAGNIKSNASIYVSGLSYNNEDAQIEGIVTNNNWETYTIYVATSESSESVTIDLWLGGDSDDLSCNGAVFFNNVHITKCGESYFNSDIAVRNEDYSTVCSLNTPYISIFNNASFENKLTDWEVSSTDNTQALTTVQVKDFTESNLFLPTNLKFNYEINGLSHNNSTTGGYDALFMYNTEDKELSATSPEITIEAQSYYRISVWAWSNSSEQNLPSIILNDVTKNTNTAKNEIKTSADITTENNGWLKYNFYVTGNPYEDKNVTLTLKLDKIGYVFFDDIRLQKITYKQYTNGSSSSNSQTLTLNYDKTDSFIIPNYNFNITTNTELEVKYPLATGTYTATKTNDNSVYGIVNINADKFAKLQESYPTASNPLTNDNLPNNENDNVLLLGSTDSSSTPTLTTSSTFTLAADSFYQFNIKYRTNYYYIPETLNNNGASIKLITSDETNPLTIIKETNLISEDGWDNLKFFIKTGSNSLTCNLELASSNIYGYVYFDDIELTSSSADTFNYVNTDTFKKANKNVKVLNLLDQDFEYTGSDSNTIKEVLNWNVSDSKEEFVKYGIIDVTDTNYKDNYSDLYNQNSVTANNNGNNVLVISNLVDNYFYLKSQDFKLTSSGFYKISVWVKTGDLNNEIDEHDDFGASVELVYGENNKTYTLINTRNLTNKNENGFVEYSFFINPTSDTTCSIKLGLGYIDQETTGTVFFDDFKIEKFDDETAYNTSIETLGTSPSTMTIDTTEESDKDSNNNNTSSNDNFSGNTNALIAASSIITALAIIIAIIGVYARKIKFKKKSKKVNNSYDRIKTIEKDMDIKERITIREELLSKNKEDLNLIQEEIRQEEIELENCNNAFNEKQQNAINEIESKKQELESEKNSMLDERNKELSESKVCKDRQKELNFNKKINKINSDITTLDAKINKIKKNENKQVLNHESKLQTLKEKESSIHNEISTLEAEIETIKKESGIKYSESRQQKRNKEN